MWAAARTARNEYGSTRYQPGTPGGSLAGSTHHARSGPAPKAYVPAEPIGTTFTHPNSFSDHASMREGLEGLARLPEPIRPHSPMPSVGAWTLVSYKSGRPNAWPNSCAAVPIGMICVLSHDVAPPSALVTK